MIFLYPGLSEIYDNCNLRYFFQHAKIIGKFEKLSCGTLIEFVFSQEFEDKAMGPYN
jgi:hypothetical protein